MPALLERPKLSSAMARALHRHVMVERERKRQEEEEVDKMMEQKLREEQERRRRKELEERMSLEETREQLLKLQERLAALQEEKHQLFLQLKKVLHEEEKRRRKEQSDLTTLTAAAYPQGMVHAGPHLLSMQGSPGGPSRAGTLMAADRAKQMFGAPVITAPFGAGAEHGPFPGAQGAPGPFAVGQSPQPFPPATPGYGTTGAGGQQLRGPGFPALPFLPQQQPPAFGLHGPFPSPGFLPPSPSLQKQLEHANSQSGFSDGALHPGPPLLPSPQLPLQGGNKTGLPYPPPPRAASPGSFQPHGASPQPHSAAFPPSPSPASRHPFLPHGQGQRFYHK
ncbi:G protein pathway suppressor 2 isoform X2 [Cuculus canorus]|uniref:G protein pathway suppressor 2 isoform X2 n=1 Tax=Cuculus canorus TaxID=55661 RepID=UPI0023AB0AD4|nr:G protein pathway suppressor 2 isoform X2 [Cuculus canorus]